MRKADCLLFTTQHATRPQLVTRDPNRLTRNSQHESMRKFSPDQLILALILGAVILGLTIYRFFYTF